MKFGIEIKLTFDDGAAVLRTLTEQVAALAASPAGGDAAVAALLNLVTQSHAPNLAASPYLPSTSSYAAEPASVTPQAVPAPEIAPAPEVAPVVITDKPLRQGDKTAAIRNFVQSSSTGVTPKEILRHLRANYTWAREATALANTVHTSLNNMLRRSIVVYDEATRTYVYVGGVKTEAMPDTDTDTDAPEAAPTAPVADVSTTPTVSAPVTDELPQVIAPDATPATELDVQPELPLADPDPELAAIAAGMRAALRRNPVADIL